MEYVRDLKQRGYLGAGNFFTSQAAMVHSGSWELSAPIKNKQFIGITAPPKGPASQATLANTDIVAINKDTKYPEEAWEFIKWFYARDVQYTYMTKLGLQPARLSMGLSWVESVRGLFRANNAPEPENLTAFVTNSTFAMPQPFFADAKVITEDIMPAINKALNGEVPTATALAAAAEVATRKLKAAK
jgi:multiple sugar transport system substrate-binding protein